MLSRRITMALFGLSLCQFSALASAANRCESLFLNGKESSVTWLTPELIRAWGSDGAPGTPQDYWQRNSLPGQKVALSIVDRSNNAESKIIGNVVSIPTPSDVNYTIRLLNGRMKKVNPIEVVELRIQFKPGPSRETFDAQYGAWYRPEIFSAWGGDGAPGTPKDYWERNGLPGKHVALFLSDHQDFGKTKVVEGIVSALPSPGRANFTIQLKNGRFEEVNPIHIQEMRVRPN